MDRNPYAFSEPLAAELEKADAVVVDARLGSADRDRVAWGLTLLDDQLAPEEVSAPASRAVLLNGYPPQTEFSSGGYYQGFVVKPGDVCRPEKPAPKRRVVFIRGATMDPERGRRGGGDREGVNRRDRAARRRCSDGARAAFRRMAGRGPRERDDRRTAQGRSGGRGGGRIRCRLRSRSPPNRRPARNGRPPRGRLSPRRRFFVPTPSYEDMTYPSAEYRLLAVFRMWNVIRSTKYYEVPPSKEDPPAYRLLFPEIGYADLTKLVPGEVDVMFKAFQDTKAIIFDMRGYPKGTAWSIAPRINVKEAKVGARFRRPFWSGFELEDTDLGGTVSYAFEQPLPPTTGGLYTGRTVMLIDDRAISQSEHSGLFFEAAAGTVFIGTPTAGANGDVTTLTLPGGMQRGFTGHDVRHADGRQLQRVGLQPHIHVAPTLAGIRNGEDQILDRALQYLQTGN